MSVRAGQLYRKREPGGDSFDLVKVQCESPLGDGEWVILPADGGCFDLGGRQVISISATTDSLLESYELDGEEQTAPVELGVNAVEAWYGSL